MRTNLALLGCPSRDSLFRLDRGVVETIAALNQVFQPLGEACGRSTIDKCMIEAQRHAEIFANSYVSVYDARFLSDATEGDINSMVVDRDAPACTLPKHSYCRYAHRPPVLLLHLWIRPTHPAEGPPADSDEHHRQESQPAYSCEALPSFFHLLHLSCPDLVMNLAEGLLIRGSDDVDNGLLLPCHFALNRDRYVHLIKQDEMLPAFATRMQRFVLIDCFSHTNNDEHRERQGLSGFRLVVPQELASPGHIDFDQAMDHGLALD